MSTNPQPIVISSPPVTFAAGAVAGTTRSPTAMLRNDSDVGVLLNRINFHPQSAGDAQTEFNVRLTYKGIPITNGWIPAHSFCWPLNEAWGLNTGPSITLSRPIYLGPGEWIDVSYQAFLTDASALTFAVSAVGRECPKPPKVIDLPYLTYFAGAVRDFSGTTTFAESSDPQDLGNPFDAPLQIERLVGLVLSGTASAQAAVPELAWATFRFSITDQSDRFWIPTPVSFPNGFDVLTRSWVVNSIMPPKGFLRLNIEGTLPGTPGSFRPLVGMVGYRRLAG